MTPKISASEWVVMNVLWKDSLLTANKIIKKLEHTNWNHRTIRTLLSRLVKKKAINYTQFKKEYYYFTIVNKDECIKQESEQYIQKVFNNSVSTMLSYYISNTELSKDEILEIKYSIDQKWNNL